jgi:hypothetical protein
MSDLDECRYGNFGFSKVFEMYQQFPHSVLSRPKFIPGRVNAMNNTFQTSS